MVQADNVRPIDVKRRNKMRDDLYERGKTILENRADMPLISENTQSKEFLHQEVKDDGIITLCQKVVSVFSAKQLATFGYEVEKHFIPISDNRAVFTQVSEDGGTVTHHQRMLTPFVISNRSVFITTYHKHSETLEGEYTLIRSSDGN